VPPLRTDARLALLLASAAVVPLVVFGASAIATLQRDTRASIVSSQLALATREAEDLTHEVEDRVRILNALASHLEAGGPELPQQARVLRSVVQQFRELRELTLFDADGCVLATSRIGQAHVPPPVIGAVIVGGVSISPPHLDDEMTLTAEFAVPMVGDEDA
jgi:hypothetical protein